MRSPRLLDRLGLLGAAAVGVVIGHAATYALAFRDPASRHALLEATGHSYWAGAVLGAGVLGAAIVAAVAIRHFRAGAGRASTSEMSLLPFVARLATLQVVLFLALEIAERAFVGGIHTASLPAELLSLGAALQVLVALGVALLLRALSRVAELVGRAVARLDASAPSRPEVPAPSPLRPVSLLSGAWGVRGPPPS